MYGAWKAYFPEDLDLDQALKEMRGEWKKHLDHAWPETTADAQSVP
jgi:hypothetical protein